MITTPKQLLAAPYAVKLTDQRWHLFTQEIRRRAKNTCRICRRSDIQTQVHHIFYEPEREPWDYDYGEVVLLCAPCHKAIHEEFNKFRRYVFGHLTPQSFKVLNGALAVALEHYNGLVFVHALAEFVSNERLVQNHADAWGMQARSDDERLADEARKRALCKEWNKKASQTVTPQVATQPQ